MCFSLMVFVHKQAVGVCCKLEETGDVWSQLNPMMNIHANEKI